MQKTPQPVWGAGSGKDGAFLGRLAPRLLPGCRLKLMPNAVSGVNKGWLPQKAASLDAADADD